MTGMKEFLELDEWKRLNVACALDEGMANPGEQMTVFYGERHTWSECYGSGGLGRGGGERREQTPGGRGRVVVDRGAVSGKWPWLAAVKHIVSFLSPCGLHRCPFPAAEVKSFFFCTK